MEQYADGENAYCIEPGISLHTGNTLEKDASVVWNNLGKEKQDAVNLALLYVALNSGPVILNNFFLPDKKKTAGKKQDCAQKNDAWT